MTFTVDVRSLKSNDARILLLLRMITVSLISYNLIYKRAVLYNTIFFIYYVINFQIAFEIKFF